MLFVVLFEDKPENIAIRQKQMAAHLAYLEHNTFRIRVAGSLRVTPEASPTGACWIVDAPDKATVEKLCHEDPFWRSGLRNKLTIFHWSKAFQDRMTSV